MALCLCKSKLNILQNIEYRSEATGTEIAAWSQIEFHGVSNIQTGVYVIGSFDNVSSGSLVNRCAGVANRVYLKVKLSWALRIL